MILEVCDLVNATEDGPKDAVRAIKKRLLQNAAKNYKTVLYTLTVRILGVYNLDKRDLYVLRLHLYTYVRYTIEEHRPRFFV